jgi:hypothetical protein
MSPEEAIKRENHGKIHEHEKRYEEEFFKYNRKIKTFKNGDCVLVRSEIKNNKMDDEFKQSGTVLKELGRNVYEVLLEGNRIIRRHASQLKRFRGGKLCSISKLKRVDF